MTYLLLLLLLPLLAPGFGPFAAMAVSAAIGAVGSAFGASKDRDMASRMKHARERALKNQIRIWKHAYGQSRGIFEGRKQEILGRGESAMGGVTAKTAGSGMFGTTVSGNMARGVAMDTNRELTNMEGDRAATEYAQWIDFANIKAQTPYDDVSTVPNQAAAWGQAGSNLGGALGMMGMWKSGYFDEIGGE